MDLSLRLTHVTGIGSAYAKRLERLDLYTAEDLINHYPFRYDDFSKISKISEAKVGETVTFQGDVWSIKNTFTKSRKILTKAILNDGTGSIEIVWFNQIWLTKNIKAGDRIQVSGKVDKFIFKISLVSPEWEKINIASHISSGNLTPIHTGRIVPIYAETYGVSSKWLRHKMSLLLPRVLPTLSDPLPESIRGGLLTLSEAIGQIHFPASQQEIFQAKARLSFDELFYIQLATQKKRLDWQKKQTTSSLDIDQDKLSGFIQSLPFDLTNAQQRVTSEVIVDLQKPHPMNRLIQGEVGSGKTVVAVVIAYLAYLNGFKTLLMAPTEILAFQHFTTFTKLLEPLGINIGIYTGSRKFTKDKGPKSQRLQSDKVLTSNTSVTSDSLQPSIIIGTHALLSEKLEIDNVGLVIIDEQQRFGVGQRSYLRNRSQSPHFLTMTATPIPRTVALTLYGDLDLSIIDELPKGRKLVRTHYVPNLRRNDAYKFIGEQIKQGRQIYIITPLIEESETMASAKAAKKEFERLQKTVFSNFKLGLLHGKLKSKEKEEVINAFKDHQIDILISTSVVEVGVDVPNATVMVIEGGECFGLAQLHQLRGRVGRGEHQSYAFLFSEQEDSSIVSRLKNMEKIYDGLKLAELDLKIRGSGEIFGTKQSGRWNLKIASLSDLSLIEKTKAAVSKILTADPNLDKHPLLEAKLSSLAGEIMPD